MEEIQHQLNLFNKIIWQQSGWLKQDERWLVNGVVISVSTFYSEMTHGIKWSATPISQAWYVEAESERALVLSAIAEIEAQISEL
ncbi:hypothetical protein PCC7418_2612 [Halothece sp. PCC 7418]|uniref:hypothetical protein n=1 Tax=Halothece sp. (strain PCC 7418) TaxID=65093 RepID=UPI0002A06B3D|nr:hypothetical protein [Halothece sp. PCC 7418]AFZ44754.1 hypothetical protein PCC7418_2612 [Halothece sp. PCC 7418]